MKTNYRNEIYPEVGDGILETLEAAAYNRGVITPISSIEAANALIANEITGKREGPTASSPAYFETGGALWKADGATIDQLGPRIHTISPAAGTATTTTGKFLVQGGTYVGKSSAGSGTFGIEFPIPFPTAQIACLAMSGDPNNTGCFYFTIDHSTEQTNAQAFFFGCKADGTIMKDTLLRCNWIAIGY